ncbi:hypothetical protein Q1695_007965 [Nippostrongylus brasiliensis]|nr:hypothetical protein Q1695_007965 [Nippostrongylus brasiliensis]
MQSRHASPGYSTKRASPVERRLHEKRLMSKLIGTRQRRKQLEGIRLQYLKCIKAVELELFYQHAEMKKAHKKLLQLLESEKSLDDHSSCSSTFDRVTLGKNEIFTSFDHATDEDTSKKENEEE